LHRSETIVWDEVKKTVKRKLEFDKFRRISASGLKLASCRFQAMIWPMR